MQSPGENFFKQVHFFSFNLIKSQLKEEKSSLSLMFIL